MIISKTPYRISFFGGGTDFPQWYRQHGGKVISTTIGHYCYITVKELPPFYPHRLQIFYSKIERAQHASSIAHPSVRETLKFLGIEHGIEIHHLGDLPGHSGLGASSAFTVGLLNALSTYLNHAISTEDLARYSIHIEQNLIGEIVGSQDQTACAHGGFNQISFCANDSIEVSPLTLSAERMELLQSHLLLFFTGETRNSSTVNKGLIDKMAHHHHELRQMLQLTDEGARLLLSHCKIEEIGHLLHQAWELKKLISPHASNSTIDSIYQTALKHGAIGGKILGAGAGGFILLFAAPHLHQTIRQQLSPLIQVPLSFENKGSQILAPAQFQSISS